jgi:hypothetical protein
VSESCFQPILSTVQFIFVQLNTIKIMKKISFFFVALLAGFFVINSLPQFTTVSAQSAGGNNNQNSNENPATHQRSLKDRQMASVIRQLTSKSTEGLTQNRSASGEISIDFEDGFQNVMLSRVEADGEPFAACITSVGEANEFFGRNLETGDPVHSTLYGRNGAVAARHGMSTKEFEFIKS